MASKLTEGEKGEDMDAGFVRVRRRAIYDVLEGSVEVFTSLARYVTVWMMAVVEHG